MKLLVPERIILQGILPKEGDFITLKLVRKLREALSFSEEEIKLLGFTYEFSCPKCKQVIFSPAPLNCGTCNVAMVVGGNIRWKQENDPSKDVYMGSKAKELCVSALKELDQKKKLTEQFMELFEKFIPSESEEDKEA